MIRGNQVSANGQGQIVASGAATILNNSILGGNSDSTPLLDMRGASGGASWGGNNLVAFGRPISALYALPNPPGLAHETVPNTCNGQPCTAVVIGPL